MASSAQEIGAPGPFKLVALVIVMAVVAIDSVGLEAGEMLVDHQIDHAGDGVGAPGGGGAAGHHIDALDDAARDGGKVDAADGRRAARIGVGGDDTLAVEQHQGTHNAQGAQIDGVDTGVALRGIAGVRAIAGRVAAAADRGEFADGVADIDLGVAIEGFQRRSP